MSHNIEYREDRGTHSFFSLRENPWHGLGQIVEEAPNSEEAIRLANLDFEVDKGIAYCQYTEPDRILLNKKGEKVDNTFFTYRKDNGYILMNNGKAMTSRYTVVQNRDAFTFFDNIIGSKQAIFQTAGSLGKGETIFITAKLPDYIRVNKTDDIIEKYLLFTSSHDGSGMVTAMFTPIRVVCNNTLNMALEGKSRFNSISFKHTSSVKDRLNQGAELLGIYNKHLKDLELEIEKMVSTPINYSSTIKIVHSLILSESEISDLAKNGGSYAKTISISTNKKNKIKLIMDSIESAPGQDLHRGTGFWLYNGITSYLNNVVDYKNQEDKFKSITSGSEYRFAQKAYDKVFELCNS